MNEQYKSKLISKSRKPDALAFLHRTACVYGALFMLFCLFRCCPSVAGALQDVYKFEHTGTFPYFLYFLGEYQFLETVCTFLLVMAELLFYVAQYRRIMKGKPLRGGIWYFFVMLVIHTAMCLHANSLPLPQFGPSSAAEEAGMHYRFFCQRYGVPIRHILYTVSFACTKTRIKNGCITQLS